MFLPVDLKRVESLSQALVMDLCEREHCHIIEDGKYSACMRKKTASAAENLVGRLNELGYVRIGTERMNPVAPYFGVRMSEGAHRAELVEYIGIDCEQDRIVRDISFLVELMFFEVNELKVLEVPIELSDLRIPGISTCIDFGRAITIISRN
jgi:hypothetical protein